MSENLYFMTEDRIEASPKMYLSRYLDLQIRRPKPGQDLNRNKKPLELKSDS